MSNYVKIAMSTYVEVLQYENMHAYTCTKFFVRIINTFSL